jgi:hypothetical protein
MARAKMACKAIGDKPQLFDGGLNSGKRLRGYDLWAVEHIGDSSD